MIPLNIAAVVWEH